MSIKNKLQEMLAAKLANGTEYKTEISSILGESTLTESVQKDFADVTESLIIKFGTSLAEELIESVEIEITNEQVALEENVTNYKTYINEEIKAERKAKTTQLDEQAEAYSKYLSEKAEEYIKFVDNGFLEFQETMDNNAAAYCEYVNENMNDLVEARLSETEEKLNKYIDYVAESYINNNMETIETSIKEELLDSLVGDLRTVFEKHNLELPESINVVNELEEDLSESESTIDALLDKVNELKEELSATNKKMHFNESTKDLTMSQRERVSNISNKLTLNESEYSDKIHSIVDMVTESKPITTNITDNGCEEYHMLSEDTSEDEIVITQEQRNMQAYIAAAQRS